MSRQPRRLTSLPAAEDAATPSKPATPTAPAKDASPATAVPASPAPPALNTKPVRTTVVLSPVEYDGLQDYCATVQRATGRRGVAGSEVMRLLLSIMRADDDLGEQVRDQVRQHIEREGGNRRR